MLGALLLLPIFASSASPSGLREGTYLVYEIDEVAFNSKRLRAIDRYFILEIAENGSITAQVNWGVAGVEETPTEVLYGVKPLNPADPQLHTLSVLIKTDVPNGFYRFGRSTTEISKGIYEHAGASFDVIISTQVIYGRSRPPLIQYNGTQYFDQATGILLHASYRYGLPTLTRGTIDLVETNAFTLEDALKAQSNVMAAIVIIATSVALGVYAVAKIRPRKGVGSAAKDHEGFDRELTNVSRATDSSFKPRL